MLTVIFFVSLIEHYPNFNARLRACVRDLVGEEVEKRIDLGLAKDGSGVGGMYSLIPELFNFAYRAFSITRSCPLCTPSNQTRPLRRGIRCTSLSVQHQYHKHNIHATTVAHSPVHPTLTQPSNPLSTLFPIAHCCIVCLSITSLCRPFLVLTTFFSL